MGGGIVGLYLIPILLISSLVLPISHYGYSKLVDARATWPHSLLSSVAYVAMAGLATFVSYSMNRNSGVLMIAFLTIFVVTYAMFFRSMQRSTFVRGLGFSFLGGFVYLGTVALMLALYET